MCWGIQISILKIICLRWQKSSDRIQLDLSKSAQVSAIPLFDVANIETLSSQAASV